jgi:DNA-binding response OmpR family regulator
MTFIPALHPTTAPSASSNSPFSHSVDPFEKKQITAALANVLVIEDDIDTSERMCRELQSHGFNAVAAFSGEEGLSVLDSQPFSLVLLDWLLPGWNGIDTLKALRARGHNVPVFLVSVLDALEDRVLGLENGADDYLVKPFAFPELLARIRARLRAWRSAGLQRRIADLVLHIESRRVQRNGEDITLTPREFDLLLYLVQHDGQTVTREMLVRDVWRIARPMPSVQNVIDVHVAHLRRKIDAGHAVKLIHTVRGEGFSLAEKPPLSTGA